MKIGVLGTGSVGGAIATALIKKGHAVFMGSRLAGNEKAKSWQEKAGGDASSGTFDEAAAFGELIFICLNGQHAIDAVKSIVPEHLDNKTVVDVTNPLDFTKGMPPQILDEFRMESLGEKIQETIPHAHVVKALNTVTYKLMVDARIVNDGNHSLFICGNNAAAKNKVKEFLADNFHWKPEGLLDLGDIHAARSIEAIVPFWVMVWQKLNTPLFNFQVVQ